VPAAAEKIRVMSRIFFLVVASALVLSLAVMSGAAVAAGSCPDEQARAERGSLALPDCRAYELVTPPDKNGAVLGEGNGSLPLAVSADGKHAVTTSVQCFAGSESCTGVLVNRSEPYEFTRTAQGWVTLQSVKILNKKVIGYSLIKLNKKYAISRNTKIKL